MVNINYKNKLFLHNYLCKMNTVKSLAKGHVSHSEISHSMKAVCSKSLNPWKYAEEYIKCVCVCE